MEPEGSMPHSQQPVPIWTTVIKATAPHPTSWKSNLILASHLSLGLPNGLFPSGLPTKAMFAPLFSLYVLHAPPISFFSISSPEHYLLSSTDHEAANYVFSIPLLPRPSLAQKSPSAPSLKHPQPTFLPQREQPIQNNKQFRDMYNLILILLESKPQDKRFCTEW